MRSEQVTVSCSSTTLTAPVEQWDRLASQEAESLATFLASLGTSVYRRVTGSLQVY